MKQCSFIRLITFLTLAGLFLNACGTSSAPSVPSIPTETLLGKYQENVNGGFSPRWLAYMIEPEAGATDQSIFIDINGTRLGPYSNLGQRFEFSPNGEHVAFAVKKGDKWFIVVDGQEKWSYQSVGFATYSWTPDLEGKSFITQTKSAIIKYSPSGIHLAYMVKVNDTEWAYYLDGNSGKTYKSVSNAIQFIGEKVAYWGEGSTGKVYIFGDSILGPYEEIWKTYVSSDNKHFVFAAKNQGKSLLIVDGKEQKLNGDIDSYTIGNAGEVAYSVITGTSTKVYFGSQALPNEYDEVYQLNISPDGKHLAFWARQGSEWSVVSDTKVYPGFDGYYLYVIGSEIYSILWDRQSENLAYFAREGKDVILALNGVQHPRPDFPGIAISAIIDDQQTIVGTSLMGAPSIDRQAFVQCLLQSDSIKCDPLAVSLIRGELAYIQTNEKESFMIIGAKSEGPFARIESGLLISANAKHYAYIVSTEKGQQAVLDGKLMDWAYEVIYRPQFIGETGFGYLGKRAGNILSVIYPIQ